VTSTIRRAGKTQLFFWAISIKWLRLPKESILAVSSEYMIYRFVIILDENVVGIPVLVPSNSGAPLGNGGK
jgi:hypothetical protein